MEEESDKTRALKEAYAEMILNTTKESAARVLISDRKSSQIHYNLNETKDEALRLLVRLKQMIDAKTVEAEITSLNKQREIDLLEAQLQEAEDIITDLRLELSWVRDKLEKARTVVSKEGSTTASDSLLNQKCGGNGEMELEKARNVLDKEQETISAPPVEAFDSVQEVVVSSLHPPNQEVVDTCFSVMSDSLMSQSSLHDDDDNECGGNDEKKFDGLSIIALKGCESEVDGNISNKKLELSLNGCTQRIHALERKPSLSVNEEERCRTEKEGEESLSSVKTISLVLALRARSAEVVTTKPLNELGIKKSRKVKGRRKRRWGKRKATKAASVRSQSQLLEPCQSQSVLQCSKTIMEKLDVKDTHMSVENEEVDTLNACNGLEERLKCNADGIGIIRKVERNENLEILGGVSSTVTDHHMVEAFEESNLVSIDVENGENETKLKPGPCLTPGAGSTNATVVSANATNQSTEKDLKSRKEDESKCRGEEDIVVSSTKLGSELVNPSSEPKATVVSDQVRESSRANGNRLLNLKFTFQRKRKREQRGGR